MLDITKLSNNTLARYATYFAVLVAMVLFTIKIWAWYFTSSQTLKLGALDSAFDTVISTANLLLMRLIMTKKNDSYMFGYDKTASLAALSQVILMCSIILYTLFATLSFEPIALNIYSMYVLLFSFILSIALIHFQKYVIKRTKSIIIKADMLHYQTDLFINGASLLCMGITFFLHISWLDAACAICIGLYLLYNILHLGKEALNILLDKKLPNKEVHVIKQALLNYPIVHLHILFSGMKEIIFIDIKCNAHETITQFTQQIQEIKHIINNINTTPKTIFINAI